MKSVTTTMVTCLVFLSSHQIVGVRSVLREIMSIVFTVLTHSYRLHSQSYVTNTGTTAESSSADSCKIGREKNLTFRYSQPEFMDHQHSNVSATSFISSDVSSIVDMDEYDSEDDMSRIGGGRCGCP